MVLAPIEPVAPSKVTLRSTRAGAGSSDLTFGICEFIGPPDQELPDDELPDEELSSEELPNQQPTRRCLETTAQDADQRRDSGSEDEAVEAIHQATMAGYQMA